MDTAEAVIALGCAMPTALAGVDRLGPVDPEHTVVVQGSGPVGLATTLLMAHSSARQIIVVGGPKDRLEAALKMGATHTISIDTTSPADRAEQIRVLTGGRGADVVLEAAGTIAAFPEGLDMLTYNGRYVRPASLR
ncbi:zinc-binding dehydrogenase [Rhodococcus opacus]|nr:zinc-binding dehydrogenase [Rhodococcus opacus]